MSCIGDGADCAEVLDQVYDFLHHELDDAHSARIQQHLDECGFCLRQYGLEQEVQHLIARSCGCSTAPEALRARIIERITHIRVTGTGITGTAAFVSETTVTFGTGGFGTDPRLRPDR
jgi:mycothiol system anti-sigma-R factor